LPGPAALQRISDAAGVSLILILSDIHMPGMSGLELLPKAKTLRPDVPVIMITAYGDAETKRKALENGAEALLTKPIDFAALRVEIDQRVDRAADCSDRGRSTPQCRLVAPNRHPAMSVVGPLLRSKPTCHRIRLTSAFDPSRKSMGLPLDNVERVGQS
jgi:CheY-like chemotaxis protein